MREWFEPFLPEDVTLEDLTEEQEERLLETWLKCEEEMRDFRTKLVHERFEKYLFTAMLPKIEEHLPKKPKKFQWPNLSKAQQRKIVEIIGKAKEEKFDEKKIAKIVEDYLTTGKLPPIFTEEKGSKPSKATKKEKKATGAKEPAKKKTGTGTGAGTSKSKGTGTDDAAPDKPAKTSLATMSSSAQTIGEWIDAKLGERGYITKADDFKEFESKFGLTRRTFSKHLKDHGLEYVNNRWIRC